MQPTPEHPQDVQSARLKPKAWCRCYRRRRSRAAAGGGLRAIGGGQEHPGRQVAGRAARPPRLRRELHHAGRATRRGRWRGSWFQRAPTLEDDSEPSGNAASLKIPGRTSTPVGGGQPPPQVAVHIALTLLITRLQTNRRRLLFHLAR